MIETDKINVQPSRVRVGMGFTRNMGDFESLRIDIGVESSSLQGESTADTLNRVYEFTEKALEEKFTETEEALKEAGLGKK